MGQRLTEELVPLIPRESRDPEIAASMRAKGTKKLKKSNPYEALGKQSGNPYKTLTRKSDNPYEALR